MVRTQSSVPHVASPFNPGAGRSWAFYETAEPKRVSYHGVVTDASGGYRVNWRWPDTYNAPEPGDQLDHTTYSSDSFATTGNVQVVVLSGSSSTTGWIDELIECPPAPAPVPPVAPSAPTRPDGLPDTPAGPDCSAASLASLCSQLATLAADMQHVFAGLGSATDQRAANQTALTTTLAAITTTLTDARTEADAIKADVEQLLPLVTSNISANLGCPPGPVTGHLLAFLPEAFAALPAGCPPATDVLSTSVLTTGDNVVDVPAGATALRVSVTGIPVWWGYRGLDPRWYEQLGYAAVIDAGGHTTALMLHWAVTTIPLGGDVAVTGAVVHLEPPLAGTIVVVGKAG